MTFIQNSKFIIQYSAFIYTILLLLLPLFLSAQTIDNHIKIDQFGYTTTAPKFAVISNPQTGYNSASTFSPGTSYQVRKTSDNSTVFTANITTWKAGITHTQSGDKVWWFDFSSLTTPGSYYIYDVTNNVRSYEFQINDCIYNEVLKQAMRTFYYQRCGVAKSAPHAGTGWTDAACHIGTQQDTDCRLHNNTVISTSKNLSGGWHDAGDYNKYVNFVWPAVIDLLLAYEEKPTIWFDDYNIPESGNGIPDILDEVKYELDWLLKMQNTDGSVLSVIGGGGASPPSADGAFRRYGPATTAASLSAAGMFALGAIQFKSLGIPAMTAYATTLETAAVNAWNWSVANPSVVFSNTAFSLAAGEQQTSAQETTFRKLCASSFLYVLTGNTTYKTFFDTNTPTLTNYWYAWSYAYPFEHTYQDAMLYYSKAPGATASVVTNIKNRYSNSVKTSADNYAGYTAQTDAYRAYLKDGNFTWGSNAVKCNQSNMYLTMNVYDMDAANSAGYNNCALGYLHYMHGVNPTAFTYLSNMSAYGAENSINEFYHSWFSNGSALWDRAGTSTYGPAPGFVPGGPNPSYSVDGCCPSGCGGSNTLCNSTLVTPPLGQPIQKSYKDWNTSWPQNSWEVTENSLSYQGPYVRMLSKFLCTSPVAATEPTVAASAITFGSVTTGSFTINWTNGDGSNRLVLVKEGSAVNSSPSDNVNYTASATYGAGSQIGSSNYVVYNGTGNSVSLIGLNPSTTYHVSVFEFNGSGSGANFFITGAPTANQATSAGSTAEPTVAASSLSFSSVSSTSFTINWTSGNGANRIVVLKQGSAVDTDPSDNTGYTANAAFSSGTQIGTGNYVIYSGTGTSMSVTGLSASTTYHVAVYEFNGSGSAANYLTSAKLIGNQATTAAGTAEPTVAASSLSFSAVATTSFTINWINGNGTRRMVVLKQGSAVNTDPSDNSVYTASATFGSGTQIGSGNYVVYSGTGNSVTVTGLTASTTYHVEIYEFNGSGATANYLTSSTLTGSQVTTALTTAKGILSRELENSSIKIFPNPHNGSFTVEVILEKNTEVEITIFNVIGTQVYSSKEEGTAGTYNKLVVLNEIPAGIYYLHVKAVENKFVEKMIKIK